MAGNDLGLEGVEHGLPSLYGRPELPGSTLELLPRLTDVELLFVTSPRKLPLMSIAKFPRLVCSMIIIPARAPGSREIDLPVAPSGPESEGKLIPSSRRRSSSLSSYS